MEAPQANNIKCPAPHFMFHRKFRQSSGTVFRGRHFGLHSDTRRRLNRLDQRARCDYGRSVGEYTTALRALGLLNAPHMTPNNAEKCVKLTGKQLTIYIIRHTTIFSIKQTH